MLEVSFGRMVRALTTYLWRHKLGGTTEGARSCVVPHVLFAKTVIANLYVSV